MQIPIIGGGVELSIHNNIIREKFISVLLKQARKEFNIVEGNNIRVYFDYNNDTVFLWNRTHPYSEQKVHQEATDWVMHRLIIVDLILEDME